MSDRKSFCVKQWLDFINFGREFERAITAILLSIPSKVYIKTARQPDILSIHNSS